MNKNNYSDDEDDSHSVGEKDHHEESMSDKENRDQDMEEEEIGATKKRKTKKSDHHDMEAEESDAGSFRDSSEEDEDEDLDRYQYDDFVVDKDEESDEDGDHGDRKHGRKHEDPEERRRRKEERRKRREEKKAAKDAGKLHRLKKMKVGDTGRDSIDDLLDEDDSGKIRDDRGYDGDIGEESEDEMDDFVVDSHNKPIHRSNRSSKNNRIYEGIFGDEDVSGDVPQKDALSLIKEQYEPSLLEEKHFTDADEDIRKKNVPERLQTRKGTNYSGEKQTYEEAEWIYEMAYSSKDSRDLRQIETISSILKFIQRDLLEVPFIYTYKKDIFETYFTLQDLWNIYDLDEKWAHLVNSKRNLEGIINNNPRLEHYLSSVRECKSEEGIADFYDLFQWVNGLDQNNINRNLLTNGEDFNPPPTQQPRFKRAIKRDLYTIYAKAGLCEFLKYYGMSAQEFGINLMDNFMTNMPTDHSEDPSTAATQFICLEADTMEEVLKATRYLMAHDIGFDPNVRQSIRVIYRRYAYITTTPTPHGFKEIDAFHPYITVKNIREKPFLQFDDTQYLLILKAEKEGYIKTSIGIPSTVHINTILPEMDSLYLSDGTSAISQQWNKERRSILADALTKFLYPLFDKEIRNKLLTEASNRVAFECAKSLEEKLRVAPWQPQNNSSSDDDDDEYESDDNNNRKRTFKIMSFCWGSGKIPTMAVVLDSEAEVVAHAKFDFLCDRVGETMVQGKKQDDDARLHQMLKQHQPRLVLVSGTEMESRQLLDVVRDHVNRLTDDNALKKSVDVYFANPEIGLALQNNAKLTDEFKEYPAVLKHAIAVGRCALDPLTEYSNLCVGSTNDILYLKLNPLQDMIGKDYLLKLLHRCFINVVNAVGVDINKFIRHKFAAGPLQFVAGLGSRKAQALLNSVIRRGGFISSRTTIEKLLNGQDVVYKNCIGFIQIREKYFDDYRDFNPLDDTRIHPEDYTSAYKIAADALDKSVDFHEDSSVIEFVSEIMTKPNKLELIDLDAFADILESRNNTQKKKVLYMIKNELTSPFADIRNYYHPPTYDQIFTWLTGETDETFKSGTLVSVSTIRNSPEGVRCRLENGLEAVIPSDCISDTGDTKSFPRGTTLSCRVKSVDKERFNVTLSCKPSDMDISKWEDMIYHDLKMNGDNKYLNLDPTPPTALLTMTSLSGGNNGNSKALVERRPVPKKEARQKRNVVHPLWKSMNFMEAEKYLKDKPVGEAILRPSSRGHDHITVTFKFWDGIILHHDIKEADKPNAVSLGKSFYMGETKFDSLDEILARHVEYLINNLNDVKTHRYWKSGSKDEIDEFMRKEKSKNPKHIPYRFGIAIERPGYIVLYHVPSNSPRHEYILVKPEGFEMRKKMYASLDELIKHFKNNYAQLLQQQAAQQQHQQMSSLQRPPVNKPSPTSVANNNNNSLSAYKPPAQSSGWSQQPQQPQQSYNNNNNNNNNYPSQQPPISSYNSRPPPSQQPQSGWPQPTNNYPPQQVYSDRRDPFPGSQQPPQMPYQQQQQQQQPRYDNRDFRGQPPQMAPQQGYPSQQPQQQQQQPYRQPPMPQQQQPGGWNQQPPQAPYSQFQPQQQQQPQMPYQQQQQQQTPFNQQQQQQQPYRQQPPQQQPWDDHQSQWD
ncbi:SH2 domain-containing protein [Cavenderia fasciculata]|uniref:SH2 domain-containing protein n=1 Tax=Cavenderia fasciculata TaxID=261658 RepID=F4QFF8_CACFS|nr:SH2 domain-containing protein [Cavenderia fasciculata]EGG14259.1 SH2 domain-containing protein [Cavenderia fasciculata]|eukprot:XP_004350968.1 SH2 domain-containing protein [Cavenderia fasciculata]